MPSLTSAQPSATSHTKAANDGGVTQVAVKPKREVVYRFKVGSTKNLKLPYAVAIDGKVLPEFANSPRRLLANGSDAIKLMVDAGSEVSLYLNSDAHPSYRKEPVYKVTPNERNVRVTVTEKAGKHADADTPTLKPPPKPKPGETPKPSTLDEYSAPLTGDIWMKVTHKYAEGEVEALLPENTSAEVRDAVKKIYRGLGDATLAIDVPAKPGQPALKLRVSFSDSNNPRDNITKYSLLADGLPRSHPAGFAALFNAAIAARVSSLQMSSCWRPVLGSIAHRAGLGLDVSILDGHSLNREELRAMAGKGKGNGNDRDLVSDAEVEAFDRYEAALKESAGAASAKKHADDALKRLEAERKKIPPADAESVAAKDKAIANAAADVRAAKARVADAKKAEEKARDQWSATRDATEPDSVKGFRVSLLRCRCVGQLFDPWFMDADGQGGQGAVANMQRGASTSNERLHTHHLHITVREPKIL